jgi:hypothetical protein
MKTETRTIPVTYAIIVADREPTDIRLMIPVGVVQADRDNVPLIDRDDNQYVGRMVSYKDTWTEAMAYTRSILETGQLHDGTDCGPNQYIVIGLTHLPRAGKPIKFAE